MAWAPKYDKLKRSNNKAKRIIWEEIWVEYKKNVEDPKDLLKIKTKLKNVERDYKNAKDRMANTGETGALHIKQGVPFFDDIDEYLGHGDAVGPKNSLQKKVTMPKTCLQMWTKSMWTFLMPFKKNERRKKRQSSDMLYEALDFQRSVHEDNKKTRSDFLAWMEKINIDNRLTVTNTII